MFSDLNVVVNVKNDNGGNKKSNDFIIKVNSTSNQRTPSILFAGSPIPGTMVKFGSSGMYDVILSGQNLDYDAKFYGDCDGNIIAKKSNTIPSVLKCTITMDDKRVVDKPLDFQLSKTSMRER
jgi:hypothetical protein